MYTVNETRQTNLAWHLGHIVHSLCKKEYHKIRRCKTFYDAMMRLHVLQRIIHPSFLTIRTIGGGTTPFTWNFGPNWPRSFKNADFQSIFAHRASAVTPSENNSVITNRKSTTRFPIGLSLMSLRCPLAPKEGLKKQNDPKEHLSQRMSSTKFLYVKTVSDKS